MAPGKKDNSKEAKMTAGNKRAVKKPASAKVSSSHETELAPTAASKTITKKSSLPKKSSPEASYSYTHMGNKTKDNNSALPVERSAQDVQSEASVKGTTHIKLKLTTKNASTKATIKATGSPALPLLNNNPKRKSKPRMATSISSDDPLALSAVETTPKPPKATSNLKSKSYSQISAAPPVTSNTSTPSKPKSNKRSRDDPEAPFSSKVARLVMDTPSEHSLRQKDMASKMVAFNTPPPVFCCADVKATDPDALYACDNETCAQRHLIKIFVAYMKRYDWEIPQEDNLTGCDFVISIAKLEPVIAKEGLVSTTRIKRGAKKVWAQNQNGRHFVHAGDNAAVTFAEVPWKEDVVPFEWEKCVKSEMEFACEMHDQEVKYKAVYWKPSGKATKA